MPQNDFSIANANGATVRADINSALQALASQNSGASAPATTYSNEFWHDDANDQMKIRDEANTAWIIIASKIGTTWIPYYSINPTGNMSLLSYTAINQNLTMSGKSVVQAATTIASGTPDFATNAGNTVSITGTATANTLGTVQAGFIAVIHYGVAITLTHNATSRILNNNGGNITTAVGDVEIALSLGSGNWRTIGYTRANGMPLLVPTATQAEMEADSSLVVYASPGRLRYAPAVAKAWVNFVPRNTNGACTINASHGVSGVSRTAAGTFQVTFTTAMSSVNYILNANSFSTGFVNLIIIMSARTTTTCDIYQMVAHTGGAYDFGEGILATFFGDLA